MLFIWKGFGLFVPLSLIPAYFLSELIYTGDDHRIHPMLAYLIAAITCPVIGYLVKRYRRSTCEITMITDWRANKKWVPTKTGYDRKTGQTTSIIIKDTFFGLPISFWSVIFIACAIFVYVAA